MIAGLLSAAALGAAPAAGGETCRRMTFRDADYTVCVFDPKTDRLSLRNLDAAGRPFGSFARLREAVEAEGRQLTFAMNAGMYESDLTPVGLYVEQGREAKALAPGGGYGNFYLRPNGVFFLAGDRAGVMETEAFAAASPEVDYATQSGPMLVIDGELHPAFLPDGTSRHIRNGVGVGPDGKAIFAISESPVNLYDFALLFRDALQARNALFLDGAISSLYALGREDAGHPMGPIVAVTTAR
jgi:uncharacterized protein YigE (DUF2233 family)